ncbi:MAG: UDP-N-acetylmuramate dehydrogenase [Bacteroidia bacterium]|nr:UDP-N-acetylmuramate dehydrogenase [Bacteroidia bacterium]
MSSIAENVSLKPFNTFGMNVQARWFAQAAGTDDLREIFSQPLWQQRNHLILGGGSNMLLTKDVDALVVHNLIDGISVVLEDNDYWYVRAGAGVNWHRFVLDCIAHGRAGVENLSLIPGSVGAGPMQNIGAYGVELKDVFDSLEAFHIREGYVRTFTADDCRFGYRESVFKHELRNQFVITSVTFRLRKKPDFSTGYGAIQQQLEKMGVQELSIKAISDAVIAIRSSKLPDPAVTGNAGSFFKNPVVSASLHHTLKAQFPDLVSYASGSEYKLAAGWLIEQCGWKGHRRGDAGVHPLQALVLVNYGQATGAEIFDLSSEILASVKQKFGVELEREVNII